MAGQRIAFLGAAALACAVATAAMAAPPAPGGVHEGQIMPASGPGGTWQERSNGYFEELDPHGPVNAKDPVTTIHTRCCAGVYETAGAVMVIKSEVASRRPDGGVMTERVERVLTLTKRPGEALANCRIVWLTPLASLFNPRTGLARAVVVDEHYQLSVFTFVDNGRNCGPNGP